VFVTAALSSFEPFQNHVLARDVVAFHVIDKLEGGSARGDWDGDMVGLVRPIFPWKTGPTGTESPAPPL
jgi:lipopolysaccharide transport system ATP-binding protein